MGAYYLQSISTRPQERKKVIETMHFISMIMPHKFVLKRLLNAVQKYYVT